MNRRLASCIAAVIAIVLVPALAAQSASTPRPTTKPALTIASFEGVPVSSQSANPGGDLADAVAMLVEESGCCRVMPREWLPADRTTPTPAVTKIRDAAAEAGIDYVVMGRVTQSPMKQPARPVMPVFAGSRPVPWNATPAAAYGMTGSRYVAPVVATQVSTLVIIDVRVVEAISGKVARTLRMERTVRSQSGPIGVLPQTVPALSGGVVGAALGAAAMQSRAKPALDRVLASIAPELAGALTQAAGQLRHRQAQGGGL